MSIWTSVAAGIRVDHLRLNGLTGGKPIKDIIGEPCLVEKWNDKTTIPCGSEGSLEYIINENEDIRFIPAYVVTIYGDLRDYEDVDAIYDWLYNLCKQIEKTGYMSIRMAVGRIECYDKARTFTYESYSEE